MELELTALEPGRRTEPARGPHEGDLILQNKRNVTHLFKENRFPIEGEGK